MLEAHRHWFHLHHWSRQDYQSHSASWFWRFPVTDSMNFAKLRNVEKNVNKILSIC